LVLEERELVQMQLGNQGQQEMEQILPLVELPLQVEVLAVTIGMMEGMGVLAVAVEMLLGLERLDKEIMVVLVMAAQRTTMVVLVVAVRVLLAVLVTVVMAVLAVPVLQAQ